MKTANVVCSHNVDGTLDEIWLSGKVHIEQMSDNNWWIGVETADGCMHHINLWTPRTRIRANLLTEGATGKHTECGEYGSGVKQHD